MFEPQAPVVVAGAFADDLRKQAQQLTGRNTGMFRELRYANRPFVRALKQLHCTGHHRVMDAAARGQFHALGHVARANPVMQTMLGNPVRKFNPMVYRDGAEHHVDCRGAAGTGEAPGIDFKQGLRHHDFGEALAKRFHHFPVHRGAATIEKPSTRQQEAARVERAQRDAGSIFLVQPAAQLARVVALGLDVGAQDDAAQRLRIVDRAMGLDRDAVVIGDRCTIERQQFPDIGCLRLLVVSCGIWQALGMAVACIAAWFSHLEWALRQILEPAQAQMRNRNEVLGRAKAPSRPLDLLQ